MSTLRPGKVSQVIADLRDAAIKEMDSIEPGVEKVEGLRFDHAHKVNHSVDDFDSSNWVARYPGQNSPHIGNGHGGVR